MTPVPEINHFHVRTLPQHRDYAFCAFEPRPDNRELVKPTQAIQRFHVVEKVVIEV